MTYPEALSYLGETRRFGVKLGLDPMRDLARALGDPQEGQRFIHLAGTNGKGSTAAFIESAVHANGHRVGLYTSPHLVSVRERIQIDRVPISELDFAEGMTIVRKAVEENVSYEATFFEVLTGLALWYFQREGVDWIVWETGLGGRLDATNIVRPEVCVITNIGLDHQQYLGNTLAEIAAEKAGIIKYGVPVISAVEPGEAADVIRQRAKSVNCKLTLASRDMQVEDGGLRNGKQIARIDGSEYNLGLIGAHQVANAACAVGALKQIGISFFNIMQGLETTEWHGRFEIIWDEPLVVLDGAHNPDGARMLVATWRALLASRGLGDETRARLVFASVGDKDIPEMARLLKPIAREAWLVRLANERSASPEKLAAAFGDFPVTCYNSVADMCLALDATTDGVPTLITGSLFVAGEMLAHRQGGTEEYRLNERLEKVTAHR